MIGAVAVCLAPSGCQHVARVGNRQDAGPPATPPPALSYRSIPRASTQPIGRSLIQAFRLGFRVVFFARLVLAVIHAAAAVPTAFVGQRTAGSQRGEKQNDTATAMKSIADRKRDIDKNYLASSLTFPPSSFIKLLITLGMSISAKPATIAIM